MAIPKKPTSSSRTSTTRNIGARSDVVSKADLKRAIMQKGNLDKPIIKKAETTTPVTRGAAVKPAATTGDGDEEKLYSPSLTSQFVMVLIILIIAGLYFLK